MKISLISYFWSLLHSSFAWIHGLSIDERDLSSSEEISCVIAEIIWELPKPYDSYHSFFLASPSLTNDGCFPKRNMIHRPSHKISVRPDKQEIKGKVQGISHSTFEINSRINSQAKIEKVLSDYNMNLLSFHVPAVFLFIYDFLPVKRLDRNRSQIQSCDVTFKDLLHITLLLSLY